LKLRCIVTSDNYVVNINDHTDETIVFRVDEQRWIAFAGIKSKLKDSSLKLVKPRSRRLFEAIESLVELAY